MKIKIYDPVNRTDSKVRFNFFESDGLIKPQYNAFFELADLSDADAIFYSKFLNNLNQAEKDTLVTLAKNNKTFILSAGDWVIDIAGYTGYLLTPGAYFSDPRQIAIPATLPNDPLVKYAAGELRPLNKTDLPKVGFCGQATSNPLKLLKDWYMYFSVKREIKNGSSHFWNMPVFYAAWERSRMLRYAKKSNQLKCDFIVRTHYKGGSKSKSQFEIVEREFFNNIINNHFTLCIRGKGNYSTRFFQALSMGRIPVLIDTDCSLPFEDIINYDDFIIRIPHAEIHLLDTYIINFWNKTTNEALIERQIKCRQLWEKYFSNEGFILELNALIHRLIKNQ